MNITHMLAGSRVVSDFQSVQLSLIEETTSVEEGVACFAIYLGENSFAEDDELLSPKKEEQTEDHEVPQWTREAEEEI